jgi:uncharacterized cupin superfamily protein
MLPEATDARQPRTRGAHTHEDEFVYVLEGEVVLRTEAGEQRLTAGMCAGSRPVHAPGRDGLLARQGEVRQT